MGRPTKLLDDLVTKRIVDAVAQGLPRDTAAKLARVAPSTFYGWLARGRLGEAPYLEFLERVREAEAKGEAELVERIRAAARQSWSAAAWLLERRRPARWALRRGERDERTTVPALDGLSPAAARARIAEAIAKLEEYDAQLEVEQSTSQRTKEA